MLNSRLMLIVPVVAMALLMSVALITVTMQFEARIKANTHARMHHLAQLGVNLIEQQSDLKMAGEDAAAEGEQAPIDAQEINEVLAAIAQDSSARILVFNELGWAVADSRGEAERVNAHVNHLQRPELELAQQQGMGFERRFDPDWQTQANYMAISFTLGSGEGSTRILQVSEPSTELDKQLLITRIWSGLAGLIGVCFIYFVSWSFQRLLQRQTSAERESLEVKVIARTRELSMLQRLGSLMAACTSVDSACSVLEPIVTQLLPGSQGAISLIKSPKGKLEVVMNWGGEWTGQSLFGHDECWALLKGHTHLSQEEGLEIPCDHSDPDVGSQLCIPLLAQGEALGVLHLAFLDEGLMIESQPMAESLAEQVGLALANIRLRDNLRQQAIRDPMTGLFNRRHMMEFLENQLALCKRQKTSMSMLMMDIDHFKKFNDTFGHDAGDYVIKKVAEVLLNQVRKCDVVCRYGGEELAVLCPDTDANGALDLANKIVQAVAGQKHSHNGQSLGKVTISSGVSSTQTGISTIEVLMKEADDALYQAKKAGRNRAELANSLKEEVSPKVKMLPKAEATESS